MKRLAPLLYTPAVLPVLRMRELPEDEGRHLVGDANSQGTAFIISAGGVFLSARHVFDVAAPASDYSLLLVQFPARKFWWIPVQAIEHHPDFDVSIGIADLKRPWPERMSLGTARLGARSAIWALGYAETQVEERDFGHKERIGLDMAYWPRLYKGEVTEHFPNGVTLSKGPSYTHTADTLRGISGGPVIRQRTGYVHGIQCCGDAGHGVCTDVAGFVDSWRIGLLGGATLRQHAALRPGEVDIR